MKPLAATGLALALRQFAPPTSSAQEDGASGHRGVRPPPRRDFYPSTYLGQGDAYNCADFASQTDAREVLRADAERSAPARH